MESKINKQFNIVYLFVSHIHNRVLVIFYLSLYFIYFKERETILIRVSIFLYDGYKAEGSLNRLAVKQEFLVIPQISAV